MSKENKPAKVAKPKKAKNPNGGIGKFFLALIMAVVVFIALIVLQTGITNKYEKKSVVVAKTDVNANTDITAENLAQFFTTIDYDVTKLPAGYVPGEEMNDKLANAFVLTDMAKGQVVTDKNYISNDSVTSELAKLSKTNLYEASFAVDSVADAVAGTLRRGDIVNVYLYVSPETEETDEETPQAKRIDTEVETAVLENVHIKQAYDGGGVVVTEESTTAATMFDIIASQDDIDKLNALLLERSKGGSTKIFIVKTNDVAF